MAKSLQQKIEIEEGKSFTMFAPADVRLLQLSHDHKKLTIYLQDIKEPLIIEAEEELNDFAKLISTNTNKLVLTVQQPMPEEKPELTACNERTYLRDSL